jgi:D-psicose/D-tagatose/L-ribulose 3-epimerase
MAAPVTELLVFSSTPDVAEDNFVVPVLAAPLDDLPARAVDHGFDGLEFLPNPHAIPDPEALRRAAARAGARVGVINTGRLRPKGYAILHRDPERRRASIDVFKRYIDLAGALGGRVGLGMARGDAETTVPAPDLAAVMRDVFGEIAAHAASAGTVVMLEPADPGYVAAILRVAEAREAAEAVASPGFSIMLDTYQLDHVEESIEAGFAAAGGMGRHIHLYDPEHWPPGIRDGRRLDWAGVRAAMDRGGFSGSASTVLAPAGDLRAQARASNAFIRAALMAA